MLTCPPWARTPERLLVANCPDCHQLVHLRLRCHVTRRNGHLHAETRTEPLEHTCDGDTAARPRKDDAR